MSGFVLVALLGDYNLHSIMCETNGIETHPHRKQNMLNCNNNEEHLYKSPVVHKEVNSRHI